MRYDKYLEKLDKIEKVGSYRSAREVYRKADKKTNEEIYKEGIDLASLSQEDAYKNKGMVQSTAYKLMQRENNPQEFLLGAQLYEKIGKGTRIIPKLLENMESASRMGHTNEHNFKYVRDFIKRTAKTEKSVNLESRVTVFIIMTLGGIVIAFNSLNTTGFAISNFTQATPSLSGLLLTVAGLVGIFLSLKR